MLGLIGIKKSVEVSVREKLSFSPNQQLRALDKLNELFEEVVVLSTCNRTEIYFNGDASLEEIFDALGWDRKYMEYVFYAKEKKAVSHLFQLSCGFHSKILGEDQILGQIRNAYEISLHKKVIKSELLRMFEEAISCGKRFRNDAKLYEIPVSSSSIAVNKLVEKNAKKIMVMGYGTIGSLVVKYALGNDFDEINIVVRNKAKVETIDDSRVNVLYYDEARKIVNDMDGVICCTAASHLILEKKHINEKGNNIVLIDLAMPRDIDEELKAYKRVTLYDIDEISKMDDDNKHLRVDRMKKYKYIVDEYIEEYERWLEVRAISKHIKAFKDNGDIVVGERVKSYRRKNKEAEENPLVETLIKSTSDYYVNRAIKVLKNERIKGREEECLKILMEIFIEN